MISKKNLNNEQKLDKEAYFKHEMFVNDQKIRYKNIKENLKDNECIIIMDFKQNLTLGMGPIQTSNDYYNKEMVSCLGFLIIYKENDLIKRKYVDYFSKILSHDSLYVKECLNKLLKNYVNNRFNNVILWCDNACHFRSSELMYHILFRLADEYSNIKFTINYFIKYHGKPALDVHFSLLQRAYNDITNYEIIYRIY